MLCLAEDHDEETAEEEEGAEEAKQGKTLPVIWAQGPLVSCCGRECGRTESLQ